MNLEQLRSEIAEMSVQEQDKLAAYLVHLRHQRDPALGREISEKIESKQPGNWITLEELRRKWNE